MLKNNWDTVGLIKINQFGIFFKDIPLKGI